MALKIDIRQHPDVCETINAILNNGKISEVKIEREKVLTVVEIERRRRIPPFKNK